MGSVWAAGVRDVIQGFVGDSDCVTIGQSRRSTQLKSRTRTRLDNLLGLGQDWWKLVEVFGHDFGMESRDVHWARFQAWSLLCR